MVGGHVIRSLDLARLPLILLCLLAPGPVHAEEDKPEAHHAAAAAVAGPAGQLPQDSATQHRIALEGRQLTYKAMAGTLPVYGPTGEAAAKVFYVSYTVENAAARPVTFVFNGGPGAGAAFLHLGALGPRIVPFQANGAAPELPVHLADNPDSWLAFTDLVFIDPVGTGYSRTVAGGVDAEKAFWSVSKDVDSMAQAVRLWLSRNGGELAPVYLAGESYGGFRVAELSNRLLSRGFSLKGTVMISPALEFSLLQGDRYAILPLSFALPSLTAANIEMREGPEAPLDMVHKAESYSLTDYLVHLAGGLKQDGTVVQALARFTGLDPDLVAKHHGRVSSGLFGREYLRKTDRILSAYDATVSIPAPRPSEHPYFDPILDGAVCVLAPAMASYAANELGFKTGLEYRLLNREASSHWDFGIKPGRQGYAGSLGSLEQARVRDPALKVFIAHGYTDLVTPFAMSYYLVNQLRPIDGAAPVDIRIYRGGHMMYLRPSSRAQLSRDVRSIYAAAPSH
jgi:carboxypeptidase C (cathepsin A)